MKNKMILNVMLLAATFFWMPASGDQVSAQNGQKHGYYKQDKRQKHKNAHGYRNYGQYRRTQVGHRRYRVLRRYYTNDRGVRLFRYIRIYF
ncbi:MAG: hypothetical protein IPI64_10410 [Chloracidobacterium sp.]|nr:hypothetical protein [Chloracidobacterium sp.]